MASYAPGAIRNVALVGNNDAGKTTLAEHLLLRAGAIKRAGTVAEGTTVSDHTPEEHERQQSIDSTPLYYEDEEVLVHLIDTPGAPDFIGEPKTVLPGVDVAMIAFPAAVGPSVVARRLWRDACDRAMPRMLLATKIDADNVDLDVLLVDIAERLGSECTPINWPNATGPAVKSVTPLLGGPPLTGRAAELREKLAERIVEVDDALLEKYLEGAATDGELLTALPRAVAAGKLVPILFVATVKDVGVAEVARAIREVAPSPLDLPPRRGYAPADKTIALSRRADVEAPFSAQVFAVVTDDFVGRISYLRVISGRLGADEPAYNPEVGRPEKIGAIFRVQGKDHQPIAEATAGMVCGITKVEHTLVGSTLCAAGAPIVYPKMALPKPMVSLAIHPVNRNDEAKIGAALRRLSDEKPTFRAERDTRTLELVASGITDLHLRLMLNRLARRFHVEVESHVPRIAYLETVTRKARAHYRHKKQSGGRGQFGEVHLEIAPVPRGQGFVFENAIVGGVVPIQYVPAVEKGVEGQMAQGVVAGYPMVDVHVKLFDGKDHAVDSSEDAFKRAASEAFKLAVQDAGPVLLEPIASAAITVQTEKLGDITGDLNARRGRILGMESKGDFQILLAEVPLGEMQSYSTELRSMTGGEGFYSLEPCRYDVVPAHQAAEIIKRARGEDGRDGRK